MSQIIEKPVPSLTAADLVERFGPIPLERIWRDPAPGTATEQDVIEIHDHKNRLCELVDGILVEKTVGYFEAYLATLIVQLIGNHVRENRLGIVVGADGMIRLAPGLIRIPDVSFVSTDRLRDSGVPREAFSPIAPDLAIEVISPSNTKREMQNKLHDYFDSGVRLVWYVYPKSREVHVYGSPDEFVVLRTADTLDGANVIPGFSLPLKDLFADPDIGS